MAITREGIWATADELDAQGVRPTLTAVRKRLGSGSYSTISDAMTEWHALRTQKAAKSEQVPDRLSEAATEFAAVTWRVARELAEASLQAARNEIDEARRQMEAGKLEAAAFADQLGKELDASKEQVAVLMGRLETADSAIRVLLAERDQERARGDRAHAVAEERSRMIDALREELVQVRRDKDAEIARLAPRSKPSKRSL